MKEIRAYIQAHKLSEVTMALIDIPGFPGMSVMDCGFGNERLEHSQNYRPFHPEKGLKYWPQTIWWK